MTSLLLKLLKPSSFKMGVIVVIASIVWYWSFQLDKPQVFVRIDRQIYDFMGTMKYLLRDPKAPATTGEVVIVDVDEASLAKVGQWPWPRDIVAKMLKNIYVDKPKVVGIDMVFAEKDRTSPRQVLQRIRPKLKLKSTIEELEALAADDANDHDYQLGETVAQYPTVLGLVLIRNVSNAKARTPFPYTKFEIINAHHRPQPLRPDDLAVQRMYSMVLNTDDISNADGGGFFGQLVSSDGIIRRVPLLVEMDGRLYPSLALEMLTLAQKNPQVGVIPSRLAWPTSIITSKQAGHRHRAELKQGIYGLQLNGKIIRTDPEGQIVVNYRGMSKTFPYISAVDILEGKTAGKFKDKYVLVGTSAAGLLDLRATPLDSSFPGVEVHANILDNILKNDQIILDVFIDRIFTLMFLLIGGLSLSALLAFTRPWIGSLVFIAYLLLLTVVNYHYFYLDQQTYIGIAFPLLTIVVVFLVVTLFNYFFEGRQRRFISSAFGRYLSSDLVELLQNNPEKLRLAGENKEMSVLFSDIRGFTNISEKMTAEELTIFLNEYLTPMTNIVIDTKGYVDKYIGDAVMAFWNAPLDDDNHADHACRCALEMINTLDKLRPEWEARDLPPIEIGIGVNSGRMSVGNMGSEERLNYTVMGDAVNLGARLEGLNKQYGTSIIISEYTRSLLRADFTTRLIDFVAVKGKQESVKIYEIICEGAPPEAVRETIVAFQGALQYYYMQEFAMAETALLELQEKAPHKLYEIYLDRIATYKKVPPADDWNGVWIHTSK